jgi:hypothetical protein
MRVGVFVHGSFGWGLDTFPDQRALADSFRIALVDRMTLNRAGRRVQRVAAPDLGIGVSTVGLVSQASLVPVPGRHIPGPRLVLAGDLAMACGPGAPVIKGDSCLAYLATRSRMPQRRHGHC